MNPATTVRKTDRWIPFVSATVVALLLGVFGYQFGTSPSTIFFGALGVAAVPVVVMVLAWRPAWMPYALIAAIHIALVEEFRIPFGGVNLRPNMAIAMLAAPLLLARIVSSKEHCRAVRYLPLLLVVNGVYLIVTLMNPGSPFFIRGLADCVLFFVNILQFIIIFRAAVESRDSFEKLVRFFFWCTAAFSVVHVGLFILAGMDVPFANRIMIEFQGETGDFKRVMDLGTTQGSYLAFAVTALLCLSLLFWQRLPWRRIVSLGMLGLTTAALALTFARGPWLAIAAAFAVVIGISLLRFPWKEFAAGMTRMLVVLVVLAVPMGAYLQSQPSVRAMFADRLEALLIVEAGTAGDRLQLWLNMAEDFRSKPWLGHGAHNYAKFREDPSQISENFVLEMFHSAGVVGGGAFLFATLAVAGAAFLRFARWRVLVAFPWGLPLAAGYLSMFLSSLTNPGMTGGYFWAGLAMVAASIDLTRDLVPAPAQGHNLNWSPAALDHHA